MRCNVRKTLVNTKIPDANALVVMTPYFIADECADECEYLIDAIEKSGEIDDVSCIEMPDGSKVKVMFNKAPEEEIPEVFNEVAIKDQRLQRFLDSLSNWIADSRTLTIEYDHDCAISAFVCKAMMGKSHREFGSDLVKIMCDREAWKVTDIHVEPIEG